MGKLEGHGDWVTCIAPGFTANENEDSPILVSGSRDSTLILWRLLEDPQEELYGIPSKSLTGHAHFITDIKLSNNN